MFFYWWVHWVYFWIKNIRQYSRQQKENWRKIPSLALEADARTGYSDHLANAYHSGYWTINSIKVGQYFAVAVDLENGELVNISTKEPVHSDWVLQIASNIDQIDTQQIISGLEEKAQEPYWKTYDPEKQDADRDALRSQLERKFTSFDHFTR